MPSASDAFTPPKPRRMNWADKISLRLALGLLILTLGLSIIVLIAVGTLTYRRFDITLLEWSLYLQLAITLPLWISLRLIDAAIRLTRRVRRAFHNFRQRRPAPYPTAIKTRMGWQ